MITIIFSKGVIKLTSKYEYIKPIFKVITGGVFGVVTGFIRFKTKSTYGSILAHSLMNIFGR
jgi:CAAX amino terminal protease family.